jgi:hypothetical protein
MSNPLPISDPLRGPVGPNNSPCKAKSKRTGLPCRQPAIPGGTVCHYHGGAAPQTKAAAVRRLEAAADSLAARLVRIALDSADENTAIRAISTALDRAGVTAKQAVAVGVDEDGPWRRVLDGITGVARVTREQARDLPALVSTLDAEVLQEPETASAAMEPAPLPAKRIAPRTSTVPEPPAPTPPPKPNRDLTPAQAAPVARPAPLMLTGEQAMEAQRRAEQMQRGRGHVPVHTRHLPRQPSGRSRRMGPGG